MWHSWISYAIDTPPPQDPLYGKPRSWAKPVHIPNLTFSRAAYKPYNTCATPNTPLLRASADYLQSQGQDQGVGARCPAEVRVGVEETTSGPPASYPCTYARAGNRVPCLQIAQIRPTGFNLQICRWRSVLHSAIPLHFPSPLPTHSLLRWSSHPSPPHGKPQDTPPATDTLTG